MAIYFTSDLHLGHKNVLQFNNRPFGDIEEMNNKLIQNINDTVQENDELWILGDFSLRMKKEEVRKIREKIHCQNIHMVYGNHDKDYAGDGIFQSVQHYKELKTKYGTVVLFHYPIMDWSKKHYGSIHLHGHIHSTGEYNAKNILKKTGEIFPDGHQAENPELRLRMWDVGVDANHYRPVSLEEIAEYMKVEQA